MRLLAQHPDPVRGPGPCTTEVDVEPGTTVADLRPHLARLTGYAGWVSTAVRLGVDDALLDETHRAGHHPLVPGATVQPGPGRPPVDRAAVLARRHVAVVAGPDSGVVVPLVRGDTVDVTGPGAPDAVHDESLDALTVRCGRRRVRIRSAVAGSLGRPVTRRWWTRSRTVRTLPPGRWRRWREDEVVHIGLTTLALRRTPGAGCPDAPATGAATGREREGTALGAVTWVGPIVGSVALAAVVRQPALLLVGLVTPVVALVAHLLGRRRRRPASEGHDGAAAGTRSATDPADLVAATARTVADGGGPPVRGGAPWASDGTLAVVGAPGPAVDLARGVLLTEVGSHLDGRVVLRTRDGRTWRWCASVTVAGPLPGEGDADTVVVCDDPDAIGTLARWRAGAPSRHRLLLVLPHRAVVPAWCRHVVEVGRHGATLHAPGRSTTVAVHAVREHRARAQLVRAHAARAVSSADAPDLAPPTSVDLGSLPDVPAPEPAAVARAWAERRAGLVAAVGRGPGRVPVRLDLVADGPHALVAGTTGAGKSGLLTALVLALATAYPPDRLAVLLVDFKGGTGLGSVAGLPHVLEHVTDLDASRTHRVLTGLRAEVRRRERLLAEVAAADIADLDPDDPGTPPRLLVVVDELRALADDVPDAVPTLARLAAQGRSLGMHLVLATQRPAGVVSADLRANVSLRIALRVTDDADSRDVVEATDAARIDPRVPGRALVRRGSGPLELVQVARGQAGSGTAPVRLADAASPSHDAPSPRRPTGSVDGPPVPRVRGWTPPEGTTQRHGRGTPDAAGLWVASARAAAHDRPARPVPWLPDLPDDVRLGDVPAGPGLALALGDLPHEQRRAAVRWEPGRGHLLVLGGPGSGRTCTLTTVGSQALAAGHRVHAVGLPAAAVAALRTCDTHGTLGTVADVHEVRRIGRLLEVLAAGDPDTPDVLLVDGLLPVLDGLGTVARGAGADRLTACWRGGPSAVAVVASADVSSASAHHASAFRDRLVLRVGDATLDALAGVPATLAGPRAQPGRAVRLGDGPPLSCQVVRTTGAEADSDPGAHHPLRPHAPGAAGVARIERLPPCVDPPRRSPGPVPTSHDGGAGRRDSAPPAESLLGVPLGVGGDTASEVVVPLGRSLLVAGPPGSGRSTALAVVAAALRAAGTRVVRLVAQEGPDSRPPSGLAGIPPVTVGDAPTAHAVLVVDDLDELQLVSPESADLVERLLRASDGTVRVVLAATSAAAAGALRGPLAAVARHRLALVLDPHDPAGAELVGPGSAWLVDPRERPPGRGVLVSGRTRVPLQVYRCEPGASAAVPT